MNIFGIIPENKMFSRKSESILKRKQTEFNNFHPVFVKWATYEPYSNTREIINASYIKCNEYLDKHFVSIFPKISEFYPRLWELFLCDFFITKKMNLDRDKNENGLPDFCVLDNKNKIWIEARAPAEHDSVEKLGNGNYKLDEISKTRYLRLSSSFECKSDKWGETYLKNGCNEKDSYIIAIDGSCIDGWSTDKGILAILYGIGLTQVGLNGKVSYQELNNLDREGKDSIKIGYFSNSNFSHISGVIYLQSQINFQNNNMQINSDNDFQFIPNINAKNPVSESFIQKLDLHVPIIF